MSMTPKIKAIRQWIYVNAYFFLKITTEARKGEQWISKMH